MWVACISKSAPHRRPELADAEDPPRTQALVRVRERRLHVAHALVRRVPGKVGVAEDVHGWRAERSQPRLDEGLGKGGEGGATCEKRREGGEGPVLRTEPAALGSCGQRRKRFSGSSSSRGTKCEKVTSGSEGSKAGWEEEVVGWEEEEVVVVSGGGGGGGGAISSLMASMARAAESSCIARGGGKTHWW